MEGLGINGPFLLAQIINFLLMVFLLQRFLYRPVMNTLEARKQRIQEGIAAADLAKQEAAKEREALIAQLESERREAQEKIRATAESSQRVGDEILAAARAEAEQIRTRAREEATAERDRILSEARKQIAELSMLATQRVLGQAIDENLQRKLIGDFLDNQMATVKPNGGSQ